MISSNSKSAVRTARSTAPREKSPPKCAPPPCLQEAQQCVLALLPPSWISTFPCAPPEGSTTTTPSTLRATISRFQPPSASPSPSCIIQTPNSGFWSTHQKTFGPLSSGLSVYRYPSPFAPARNPLLLRRRQHIFYSCSGSAATGKSGIGKYKRGRVRLSRHPD